MTVKPVTYYEVHCDEPGCTRKTADLGGDFSAWGDEGAALDEWLDSDGVRLNDGRTFCWDHRNGYICDDCGEPGETTINADGDRVCVETCAQRGGAS